MFGYAKDARRKQVSALDVIGVGVAYAVPVSPRKIIE
tara:strand:+ start:1209 stop:1319 length:111 start_codon:yes stop_codon:yes gene_type:complete